MQLLLRRGANPNVCSVPMPALVFTIKAGDMEATKLLLLKGADANLRLSDKVGNMILHDFQLFLAFVYIIFWVFSALLLLAQSILL